MEKKEMICIVCPVGCRLEILKDKKSETGYIVKNATCSKGEAYALKELTSPTRAVTSTVRIKNGLLKRLPVRTDGSISKDKIFECINIINAIEVEAPIKIGDVIIENILGEGVNIVASRSMALFERLERKL